jgi:hypothetical protein
MTSKFRDIISLYHAKREEVEKVLSRTFLLWVNAPDDESDRQGYLFLGSPLAHQSDRYELFRYFVIGGRSADMRDMEEILAYGDSEARTNYSEEGDDYHAIVGARTVSEYLKIVLRAPDEPIGLAVETVLRDESGELIVVHYDGEYERIPLDRKVWWKFLGGSHDPKIAQLVLKLADANLNRESFHPDQTDALRDALRAEFSDLADVQRWRMNFVVGEDPEPKQLHD